MNSFFEQHIAIIFPLYFATLWLAVTTILAVLSGWFRLAARYPDQPMEPLLRLRRQSGAMGLGVSMGGILILAVCPSGLRIGIMRAFGPFCRDFFVPWEDIKVIRSTVLFWPIAKLQFGEPAIGSLTISARIADRLARAAVAHWPEAGPFPEETPRGIFRRIFLQWAITTCAAALFFTLVPLAVSPPNARPPIVVAILFPAIAFAVFAIVRFVWERVSMER